MAECLFDQCCGCIKLKTGCLILGYLQLIESIISLVILAVMLKTETELLLNDKVIKEQLHEKLVVLFIMEIALMVILVALFAFSIVFLVGIHQNKRGHVKVFLVFLVIIMVLTTIIFFVRSVYFPINGVHVSRHLIATLLDVYFFLVIRSYYYKMKDEDRQPAIYNSA